MRGAILRFRGVLRKTLGSRLARDYTLAGGGLGLARLASLASLVILSRALTTSQFAVYALGWAAWLLTSQMATGLDIAYVDLQARDDAPAALLGSYWTLKIRASLALALASVAAVLLLQGVASWGSTQVGAAIVGAVSGAATALYTTELSVHQARRQFGRYAAGWILLNLATLAIIVLLVAGGVTSAFPYLFAYGLVPVVLTLIAEARSREHRRIDATEARRCRSKLGRHARWLLPSGVLTSFSNRVDVFIASALLVTHAFADYAAVARFFGVFGFALTTMGSVLLPRASRIGHDTSLRSYLAGAFALTTATGLVGLLCIWQAHNLALLLLGRSYVSAASLVPAICVAAVFLAAEVTLGYLLFSVGRPGAFALVAALVLIAKVIAALLLMPTFHARGAAWSLAIGYATATFFIAAMIFFDRQRLYDRARGVRTTTDAVSPAG